MLYVSSSPSTSEPETLILVLVSSSKLTSDTVASIGASLTANILRLTLALDDSKLSSTLKIKLSSPL